MHLMNKHLVNVEGFEKAIGEIEEDIQSRLLKIQEEDDIFEFYKE